MLKAGYKGHAINEIIWMGDVVNGASNLCHLGNKGYRKAIQISPLIQKNITREDYLKLLAPVHGDGLLLSDPTSYEGDLVSIEMDKWIEEEQAKYKPRERTLADILYDAVCSTAPGTTLLTSDALAKVPSKSLWG